MAEIPPRFTYSASPSFLRFRNTRIEKEHGMAFGATARNGSHWLAIGRCKGMRPGVAVVYSSSSVSVDATRLVELYKLDDEARDSSISRDPSSTPDLALSGIPRTTLDDLEQPTFPKAPTGLLNVQGCKRQGFDMPTSNEQLAAPSAHPKISHPPMPPLPRSLPPHPHGRPVTRRVSRQHDRREPELRMSHSPY